MCPEVESAFQEDRPDARILTPDQRLRVFVSSTLNELADERAAVRRDNMAELLMWQGRKSEAACMVVQSLTALVDLRMTYAGVGSLNTAAWLLTLFDDWFDAVRVQSAADAVMENMNAGMWPMWLPPRERLLKDARERLGDADFERARAAGCEWVFEQAVAETIAVLDKLVDASESQTL